MKDKVKVLVITADGLNYQTGGAITLRNLFSGWPNNQIATIHTDELPQDHKICSNYYKITEAENKKFTNQVKKSFLDKGNKSFYKNKKNY